MAWWQVLSLDVGAAFVFQSEGYAIHSSIRAPQMLTGVRAVDNSNMRQCKLEDAPYLWSFAVARATLY